MTFETPQGVVFIKRVVAVAGDFVQIGDDGTLTINGRSVERSAPLGSSSVVEEGGERYACTLFRERLESRTYGICESPEVRTLPSTSVPAGHVFVLGDNRGASRDSRDYGAIALSKIRGRPLVRYSGQELGWVR